MSLLGVSGFRPRPILLRLKFALAVPACTSSQLTSGPGRKVLRIAVQKLLIKVFTQAGQGGSLNRGSKHWTRPSQLKPTFKTFNPTLNPKP